MDFSKLSEVDLKNFLLMYQQADPNLTDVQSAQILFERLKHIKGTVFSIPVVDLYIATQYSGSKDKIYTEDQIMNLSKHEILAFDQIFQFGSQQYNDQTNRERIMRILDYLGLISKEQPQLHT